jgi:hypothetical protein
MTNIATSKESQLVPRKKTYDYALTSQKYGNFFKANPHGRSAEILKYFRKSTYIRLQRSELYYGGITFALSAKQEYL